MTRVSPSEQVVGNTGDRVSRAAAALSLLASWVLFFFPHLTSSGVPFYRDQLVTLLPVRAWVRQRLLAGELPEWFPHEALGLPLAGQLVTQTFHPLTWLLLPFEPAQGLKLAMLAAYGLALSGAYRLARTLAVNREAAVSAAIAFAFGGYALGQASNLVYTLAYGTAPWALVAAARLGRRPCARAVIPVAVSLSLVLLAGDVQGFGLCVALGLALLRGAPWRAWGLYAGGVLLALVLAAPEFLPSLVVSGESMRRAGAASERFGREWAFSAWRLPELLVGGYIPDGVRNVLARELLGEPRSGLWSTTLTMGAVALACLGAGLGATKRRQPLLLVALGVGGWLALGEAGGLWTLAARLAPPVGWFRYPEKYLALVWLAAVAPVAFGASALLERGRRAALPLGGGSILLLALALLAGRPALVAALLGAKSPVLGELPVAEAVAAAWEKGLLVAGLALLALAAGLAFSTRVPMLLAAVLFGELLVVNGHHFPLVDPVVLEEPNPFAEAAKAAARPDGAVLRSVNTAPVTISLGVTLDTHEAWVRATRRALVASTASRDGVAGFKPNLPLSPARLTRLQQRLREVPGALGRAGVCFATLGTGPGAPARPLAVDAEHGLLLAALPCEPRAAWVSAEPVEDLDEALAALSPGRGPTSWEGLEAARPLVDGHVRWLRDEPEWVELEVDAAEAGALLLRDQFFPGWTAEIDGGAARLYPVEAAMRGVLVPAGRHRVAFRYVAPRLRAGLSISGLTLLGFAVALVVGAMRDRRSLTGDVVAGADR